jgi:hypothetical protein
MDIQVIFVNANYLINILSNSHSLLHDFIQIIIFYISIIYDSFLYFV